MNIFIDGEWNSYGGELISLALVAEDGRSFYEVLGCDNPDPWVAENVMPKLGKPWIALQSLQEQLELFLSQFDCVNIIADWPEDIAWFCKMLITGPGTRLNTPPLTMQVLRVDTVSSNPHHALYDALALRDWYEQAEQQEPVAWRYALDASVDGPRWIYIDKDPHQWLQGPAMVNAAIEELHTSPQPSKPWVGLTDEQVEDEWERITGHSIFGGDRSEGRAMYISPDEVIEFSRAIEAKLKEKNT